MRVERNTGWGVQADGKIGQGAIARNAHDLARGTVRYKQVSVLFGDAERFANARRRNNRLKGAFRGLGSLAGGENGAENEYDCGRSGGRDVSKDFQGFN